MTTKTDALPPLTISTVTEARRGCGHRSPAADGVGVYLRTEGEGAQCHRLPLELHACAACGEGIQPSRGIQRINPREVLGHPNPLEDAAKRLEDGHHALASLVLEPGGTAQAIREQVGHGLAGMMEELRRLAELEGGEPPRCALRHCSACPVGAGLPEGTHALSWVGEKHYTARAFVEEANERGISRKVSALPKGLELGTTWIYFGHAKGLQRLSIQADGDVKAITRPAIIYAAKPTHVDLVVDAESPEGLTAAQLAKVNRIRETLGPDKVNVLKVNPEEGGGIGRLRD